MADGGGGGVVRYDPSLPFGDAERYRVIKEEHGLPSDLVSTVFRSTDGAHWFGTMAGATRMDSRGLRTFSRHRGEIDNDLVEAIFQGADGLMWFATAGGISCFDGEVWSWLDSRDGLTSDLVKTVTQDSAGQLWFGTTEGLTRYRPTRITPRAPTLTIQSDRDYTDLAALPSFMSGTRVTFKFNAIDLRTRAENRQYRWQLVSHQASLDEFRSSKNWSAPSRTTHFEWSTNRAGTYTLAVQYIDRDLNRSEPALATVQVVVPWHANMAVMVPAGAGVAALLVWALIARLMYQRKQHEADRLREQLLAEEHAGREAAERARAELEAKNVQLVSAKEAADAASKAKSFFLANMSHEIRTPMNAILGYSQILKRDAELPPRYRPSIETIEQSGDHLLAMINDILDLSKIEAGRMELQESDFDLTALIQGIKAMFTVRCEEKKLKLEVDGLGDAPCPVHADEGKLRQVLINLLGNAVKFTERGSVTLQVRGQKTEDRGPKTEDRGQKTEDGRQTRPGLSQSSAFGLRSSVFCFSVIDTGQGMSAENQRDLFQPFQQGTEGRMKGGTGLGLAITKRQIELMGGTIEVESKLGQGSRFFFQLLLPPAQGPVSAREEKTERQVMSLAADYKVRALVVDDLRQNREVLSQLLKGIGCEVALAEGGVPALERLRVDVPDIVFMDIRMPDLDGPEVLEKFFAEFGRGRTKLVAVSASVLAHEQKSYVEAGFDAFVGKPFRFEEICACLKDLLHVKFRYAEEPEPATPTLALDPRTINLPAELLSQLREAANRYSVTKLEQGLAVLENDGPAGKQVAAYCRGLIQRGDLESIAEFLQSVSHE
jgi:signal transduction histidine kinase/DNA-binding response OmpR family regulator